jgi:endonuclease III
MGKARVHVPELLSSLESFYGPQEPHWPTDPYQFLVWWYCGYPASDAACAKGWEALNRDIGTTPEKLLAAPPAKLAAALKPGGMVPELRAMRLKEIAVRVKDSQEFPQYRRPRRRPYSALCRHCAGGGRAFELSARAGTHPTRTGAP